MSHNEVVIGPDADLLGKAIAARIVTRLVDAQAANGHASIVLTGGRLGIGALRELRQSPARDAVDWRLVDVWWGDERFLPTGDPERNDTQADEALLGALPLDPARVHRFPAPDGPLGDDPEAAAQAYAKELAAAAGPDEGDVPRFDVLMLGVGEEGHTASIFPESPAVYDERPVVAVRECPKPPPIRLSLTFSSIAAATEVWLATTGAEKAEAVASALTGATPAQIPAAGAKGRSRTIWLLDRAAASKLPPELRPGRQLR
ncbi:MAG TPA: 6-phosphogluconolactonase [Mycobacteriales bacterium]|nr:6-phosphogluconolactonase [Mycobacteriales bacterium]